MAVRRPVFAVFFFSMISKRPRLRPWSGSVPSFFWSLRLDLKTLNRPIYINAELVQPALIKLIPVKIPDAGLISGIEQTSLYL